MKIIINHYHNRVVSATMGGKVIGRLLDIGVVLLRLHSRSRTSSAYWEEPQPGYTELHITFDLEEKIDINDLIPDTTHQAFKIREGQS